MKQDDIDFTGMTSEEVGNALAEKTMRELAQGPIEDKQNSRNWQDPEGYRYLYPWSNGVLLRFFIRKFTDSLPPVEQRRKKQMDDAGRSFVRNIEEGYKRPTTKAYLEFLGFSQGSLEEVRGDIRESAEDKFLKSIPYSSLAKLGIDLKELNLALKKPRQQYRTQRALEDNLKENIKDNLNSPTSLGSPLSSPLRSPLGFPLGSPLSSRTFISPEDLFAYHDILNLYPLLKKIKSSNLSYEIFMELINKTDYLLRQLVVSLENKLNLDHKYYQVEQIRLNRRTR